MAFSDFSSLDGTAQAPRPAARVGNFSILAGRADYRGHYNPNQPRVPKGHREGGQWTHEGSHSAANAERAARSVHGRIVPAVRNEDWKLHYAAVFRPARDALYDLFRRTKGHHIGPLAEVRKRAKVMAQEAIDLFSRTTIGGGYLDPKDPKNPHRYDKAGREYNNAVGAEMDKFIREKGISSEKKMDAKGADELLKSIANSDNPAIRDYNRRTKIYAGRKMMRSPSRGVLGRSID